MKPREVDVVEAGIVDSPNRRERGGNHLSDVIQYIRAGTIEKFREEMPPELFHRFMLGEGFEAGVFSRGLAFRTRERHEEHYQHQWTGHSFKRDGLSLTTDAVCLTCGPALVWETKATWYSSSKDVLDPVFRFYLYQLMSYVLVLRKELGTAKVMGRFVFGFVNGDYRSKREPIIRAWDMPWSTKELESNWEMILRVRDEMGRLNLLKGE